MAFGHVVLRARSRAQLSQKEVAAQIVKEDGRAITPQYVHDIEVGRRKPRSDLLIEQLAVVLDIPREVAFYYADRLPPEMRQIEADDRRIVDAWAAFHRILPH